MFKKKRNCGAKEVCRRFIILFLVLSNIYLQLYNYIDSYTNRKITEFFFRLVLDKYIGQ